jgi:fluoride ion exporter CrcB/FEX
MSTATSFWYQAGLNAVGPFVTAIVGSLLIGILVQAITRGAQERRAARELRYALIAELTGGFSCVRCDRLGAARLAA